jgi:TorA maturation chaperone TorD
VSRHLGVAHALSRAAVYGVLAAALDHPTPERLRAVPARATAAARAPGVPAAVRAALDRLAAAAGEADADAVTADHAALFAGAVRCSPYEGAWGTPSLAGKAAGLADVAGFYAAFGLAPTSWNAELEDHVAVECEFSAALALKEAHARAAGRDESAAVTAAAAAAFLRDHLGRWAHAFARELGRQAATPLYREAAALLGAWLDAELARLGLSPARVTGPNAEEAAPFSCPMASPAPEPAVDPEAPAPH